MFLRGPMTWKVMPRNVWNDIVLANKNDSTTLQRINSMHRRPSFQRRKMKSVGELSHVCSQNCSEMFIFGMYWKTRCSMVSVQTCTIHHKMDQACDKRLSRWISCTHHTSDYKQQCHVGNTAKQCRLGLFQNSDFAGDLEDSKSTSGETLRVFGSHTFVPMS